MKCLICGVPMPENKGRNPSLIPMHFLCELQEKQRQIKSDEKVSASNLLRALRKKHD